MQIISHCKTRCEHYPDGADHFRDRGRTSRPPPACKDAEPAGAAMAVIGGDLLRRAITGHSHAYEVMGIRTAPKGQGAETTSVPYELGIRVDRSITH